MNRIRNPFLALVFMFISTFQGGKDTNMAIEYDGITVNQTINFAAINSGLSQKSIVYWINPDTFPAAPGDIISKYHSVATFKGWGGYVHDNDVYYFNYWSTTAGGNVIWKTTGDYLSTGSYHQIVITYDNSSASNDPLIYVDGVARATTESANAPSGSATEDATDPFKVGATLTSTVGIDGKLTGVLVYNRILSASEILDSYNSRLAIPTYRGLVFAPLLQGASGLQNFDGATLSGSNLIIDQIAGSTGTPSGSPVGRADTILSMK